MTELAPTPRVLAVGVGGATVQLDSRSHDAVWRALKLLAIRMRESALDCAESGRPRASEFALEEARIADGIADKLYAARFGEVSRG